MQKQKQRKKKEETKSSIFSVEENLLWSDLVGAAAAAANNSFVFLSFLLSFYTFIHLSICESRKKQIVMVLVVDGFVLSRPTRLDSINNKYKTLQFTTCEQAKMHFVYIHFALRIAQKDAAALHFTCCFDVLFFNINYVLLQTNAVGQCTI